MADALDVAFRTVGVWSGAEIPELRWAPGAPVHERNSLRLWPFGSTMLFDLGFPNLDGPGVETVQSCAQLPESAKDLLWDLREALRYLEHRGRLTLERVQVRYSAETGDYELALWRSPGHFPPAAGELLAQRTGASSVVLVPFDGPVDDPRPHAPQPLAGVGSWCETVGDEAFLVSALSRFPESTQAAAETVQTALALLGLSNEENVCILGAGVGLFALPVSRVAGQVACYQPESPELGDLQRNVVLAPVDKVTVASVLDGFAEAWCEACGPFDAVLLDADAVAPDSPVMQAALAEGPSRIVISCSDAASLAGAAGVASLAGSYRLDNLCAVEVLPDTGKAIYLAKLVR